MEYTPQKIRELRDKMSQGIHTTFLSDKAIVEFDKAVRKLLVQKK